MNVIGIDVGGTDVKAGIINLAGDILYSYSEKTPIDKKRNGIVDLLIDMIEHLKYVYSEKIVAIGIGTAGRVNPLTGKVLFATDNLPGWTGTEVKNIIEKRFSLPVFVENDVNAAALGEGWMGAAKDNKHFVFVSLGTGVGGSLIHNKHVISGENGGAGEIGHIILYPDGILCNCGQSGCFEQYASGSALNKFAQKIDKNWSSYELFSQYANGNDQAVYLINDFIRNISIGLLTVQNFFDPECIILGGGLIKTYHLWSDGLNERIKQTSPVNIKVMPALAGNKAGILGAAFLAMNNV